MNVVLDTCAAFEVVFSGEKAAQYKEILQNAEKVLAPSLFDAEISNVLWKYVKGGYVDEQNAKLTMLLAFQLPDEYTPTSELAIESLHEAARLNHPVYDIFYMVLARRTGSTLLTVDKKLAELCKSCGVDVL